MLEAFLSGLQAPETGFPAAAADSRRSQSQTQTLLQTLRRSQATLRLSSGSESFWCSKIFVCPIEG